MFNWAIKCPFQTGQEVSIVDRKLLEIDSDFLSFYNIPRWVVECKNGVFVKRLNKMSCVVTFTHPKSLTVRDVAIPIALLEVYYKTPNHKLTKIFM